MSVDFEVIIHVRQQFGESDLDDNNFGVFAGTEKDFDFNCPRVNSSEHSLLMFQTRGVDSQQSIKINGTSIFGGIPFGAGPEFIIGETEPNFGGIDPPSRHTHSFRLARPQTWSGNTMIVGKNILRSNNNVLTITATETFIIDNVILLYKKKTRPTIPDVSTDDAPGNVGAI